MAKGFAWKYKYDKLLKKDFISLEGIKINRSETEDLISILAPKFV